MEKSDTRKIQQGRKLIIFPGGGSPDSELYSRVYGLLVEAALAYDYTGVDTSIRWPGHISEDSGEERVLTFQGALDVAAESLEQYEAAGESYDILARSFGTYVALKATNTGKFNHLGRIILWGPPPFWLMWQLFVRDLEKLRESLRAKKLNLDETFFPSIEPIECLLLDSPQCIVVCTGELDPYCTPVFHSYLMQLAVGMRHCEFRPAVKGAPHEVTKELGEGIVENYAAAVFGT